MPAEGDIRELVRVAAAPPWKFWISRGRRAAARERIKSLVARNPRAHASALEAALDCGDAKLVGYLVKQPHDTRNWDATCTALAWPHPGIRWEVVHGLTAESIDSTRALEEHPELISAAEKALRQGGSPEALRAVCHLLYEMASTWSSFDLARSNAKFREAEEAARQAYKQGRDPRTAFAALFGEVQKGTMHDRAMAMVRGASEGELGAGACTAMREILLGQRDAEQVSAALAERMGVTFSQEAQVRRQIMRFWEPAVRSCGTGPSSALAGSQDA